MMEGFSEKIQSSLNNISKKSKISDEDIKKTIKEIRLILLEADVNYQVAKEFCKIIEAKIVKDDVLKGLNPSEQIIKIVKDQMIELLDGNNKLDLKATDIILMVGLQGSGKTTTTGKLANFLRKKQNFKKPLVVACDVYRPAAIDQLITIAKQLSIDIYYEKDNQNVLEIVKNANAHAIENNNDLIILDTAGRMHVETELMDEIKDIQTKFNPKETLLVLDGTIGQMAVDITNQFQEYVNISGLIFSKMDGDTRGGGLFSVKKATGIDIKFLGISEKMDGLEEFNPERIVGRILGMGDVLGLIEKAEELNTEETEAMANKMLEGKFDLNDFLKQIKMLNKMGGLKNIMRMIPGAKKIDLSQFDEKEINKMKAIIEAMTIQERTKPSVLNGSRRQRIAKGSGVKVQDVNKLIKGYENSKKMMKQFKGMDPNKMMNMLK